MSEEENEVLEKLEMAQSLNMKVQLETEQIVILCNLIEKQQKEIKELNDSYSDEKIRNTIIKRYGEVIEKDYISKDKIRAKIRELELEKEKYFEKQVIQGRIDLLKELLEEN